MVRPPCPVSYGNGTKLLFRSLYIQALSAMQNTPESDLLSYYQISGEDSSTAPKKPIAKTSVGIHGRPYTSWDNVGPGVNTPLTGYCTHGEYLRVRFNCMSNSTQIQCCFRPGTAPILPFTK